MKKELLHNIIDTHIHTAPDAFKKRKFNDYELANEAEKYGAKAIVIKSHAVETAARAKLVNTMHEKLQVFGGLALNEWEGGLNPYAVEATLDLGGKIIWFPTLSAANELQAKGMNGGVWCLDSDGDIKSEVKDILKMIADADAILATGHISYEEMHMIVIRAREFGVKNIIINHPELYRTRLSVEQQRELLKYNVIFERTLTGSKLPISKEFVDHLPLALENIKVLGAASTIIATDVGQPNNPNWSEAYCYMMEYFLNQGVSKDDIEIMTRRNQEKLLGI